MMGDKDNLMNVNLEMVTENEKYLFEKVEKFVYLGAIVEQDRHEKKKDKGKNS